MSDRTRRFRQLLNSPEMTVAPGVFGPLAAPLVEEAGFPAVYMSGAGTALALRGVADVGLLTLTEMLSNVAAIAETTGLPLLADADTGFGGVLNVRRTVREYERAGAAGLHVEDQLFPKRCGHLDGKQLVPTTEMVAKIRAAKDARTDDDFVVVARCDAILVDGLDEALRRGEAYAEAGADALFIESPRSEAEVEKIGRSFDVPLVFNMASSGRTPFLTAAELERLGYSLMILPNFTTQAAIKAMREVLATIRESGGAAEARGQCVSFHEFMELGGLSRLHALEQMYAGSGGTARPQEG